MGKTDPAEVPAKYMGKTNPAGMPVKNEERIIEITDFGKDGEGIGRTCGYTLFVKGAVPGDIANVLVTKAGKNFGYAHLMGIVAPSRDRVPPICPVAKRCGGCQLMHVSYEAQTRFKQKKVEDALRRIGGFDDLTVEPIRGADRCLRYRNKAQYPVGYDRSGKLIAGFYARHSHEIVPAEDCYLSPSSHRVILRALLKEAERYRITAYDEKTGKGLLRHILIREGFSTGEIHVTLVVNGSSLPHGKEMAAHLMVLSGDVPEEERTGSGRTRSAAWQVTGVTLNENTSRSNVILGQKLTVLAGREKLTDRIGGTSYEISPLSFYQVNPYQTKVLYDYVKEYADLKEGERVLDLYCGIGTIGLYAASSAGSLTGVEIVSRAVEDARENARKNGMEHAAFYAGAAEEVVPRLCREGKIGQPGVIIVDPPRKGCDKALVETILEASPKRLVYVSCDPATLARDLRIFCDGGYRIEKVQPVDMFPETVHIETIVLLQKLNS